MAVVYAQGKIGHGKAKFNDINSRDKLWKHSAFKRDAHGKYELELARNGCYFNLTEFPQALKLIGSEVWAEGIGNTRSYLFYTSDHAMAIRVMRKTCGLVVCFYDPNNTARHKRFVINAPEDTLQLTIDEFLTPDDIKLYFPANTSSACFLSTEVVEKQDSCQVSVLSDQSEDLSLLMLDAGHYGIDGSVIVDHKVVASKKDTEGQSGFNRALCNDHHESVTHYIHSVLTSKLSDNEKIELLMAKNLEGTPGLNDAFTLGHTNTVIAYTKAILNSKLGDDQKTKLLMAKDSCLMSGLSKAIENNHRKTARAFLQLVDASKMELSNKFLLGTLKCI